MATISCYERCWPAALRRPAGAVKRHTRHARYEHRDHHGGDCLIRLNALKTLFELVRCANAGPPLRVPPKSFHASLPVFVSAYDLQPCLGHTSILVRFCRQRTAHFTVFLILFDWTLLDMEYHRSRFGGTSKTAAYPLGVNVFLVAQRIKSALRSNGIKGPVTISGFGDIEQLSRTAREALTSTGICLNHVPHGGKMSLQSCFMADLIYWVLQNPPPVHFFLISGDKDFANILHRLRMNNYNILLASREFTPGILCSSATLMWSWTCLVKGGNASAKHFNHPPDGFYGSWYGHYKAVLDDPFSDMKQANGKGDDYVELSSESKHRPVPRALVNAIQQILYSYPEGINMSDLRNELKRMNMSVDKDFFGYKNFSHLLASMPNILKFITSPGLDGQPLVVGKHLRTTDSSPSRSKTIQDFDSSDGEMSPTPKQDGKTTLSGSK
ncbi:hypothetical protein ZIOFF_005069 [Zingiber officinale]|uniref:HTH OST-type domain-containing protein n=1 Tax=Zingiber officinale TaxID=94328 RepID=A0A8J5LMB2_ZINOF|nr:hypothetical protein ZIOFF_005069 [Zingiber officinale]